jgi:hypothetical protein
MKRILLTSTALVMVAGIAAADGHASMTWSGSAKAGVAREGTDAATGAVATLATAAQITAFTTNDVVHQATFTDGTTIIAAEMTTARANVAATLLALQNAASNLATRNATTVAAFEAGKLVAARETAKLNYFDGAAATAKADAGSFEAYSEVSTTVTGTVTAGGITLSTGVSVDAGRGYDFDDDPTDDFDAAKTNGVSLDAVSIDMGSAGKLTLNDNAITHLVDGDDDAAGDVKYTNTFGVATFSAVVDLEKDDLDDAASNAVAEATFAAATVVFVGATASAAAIAAVAVGDMTAGAAAVAADVQWSAKVEMPVGSGTVYVAMDEESGNAFGGTALVSGMTLSVDSKLEALGADLKSNRQNTIGVAMTMGAINGKFTYDSLKDGNQWGVSAGYTAGDMSVAFATNEASSWSVTGGYALGAGASVKAGVNYTEDAFLGLSFAF